MTMRITVKNEDLSRTAEVEAQEFEIGKPTPTRSDTRTLKPGASAEFYIHAAKRLIVTENPNA